MKIYTFEAEQTLPIDQPTAWAFLSDPRNLKKITPPSLGMTITSAVPEQMYAGMIVTCTVSPLLVPMTWVTEITHVEPGRLFVDEQRFGPYRFWHHQHWLDVVPGGVNMRDIIHYALPFDPLSRVVHPLLVRPQLHKIFAFRRDYLTRTFGAM